MAKQLIGFHRKETTMDKKWSFPVRVSSLNGIKLLRMWSHLLKKPSLKNFVFCAVSSVLKGNFFWLSQCLNCATLLKKKLWNKYVSVNFAKLLKIEFYDTPEVGCFWQLQSGFGNTLGLSIVVLSEKERIFQFIYFFKIGLYDSSEGFNTLKIQVQKHSTNWNDIPI